MGRAIREDESSHTKGDHEREQGEYGGSRLHRCRRWARWNDIHRESFLPADDFPSPLPLRLFLSNVSAEEQTAAGDSGKEYEYRPDQTGLPHYQQQAYRRLHRGACRLLFFLGEVDHHLHFARFDGAGDGDGPRIVG